MKLGLLPSKGFQNFVDESALRQPTAAIGTPGAGVFHSTIVGRASIPDLANDLKVQMGIERIQTQNIFQLQNEFGPNGEAVHGALNDLKNQIRFIGAWAGSVLTEGAYVVTSTVGDYAEVTFYGTGLNLLLQVDNTARDFRVSVDGLTESGNLYPTSGSAIINGRNYASNQVINLATALGLGVHTVKIRLASGVNIRFYGFEILTETTSLRAKPGLAYSNGQKIINAALQSPAHNTGFESGTLGSRGGRVLVYQKSDGTIGKAVQPANASQANLTSADHSNEEVIRTYNWREFGAGRSDDFSQFISAALTTLYFTLDDGTTTLTTNAGLFQPAYPQIITVGPGQGTGIITLTFVGTGLDVKIAGATASSGNAGINYIVDGTSISGGAQLYSLTSAIRTVKVVSGLPYGTHTVQLSKGNSPSIDWGVYQYVVYGPKKPTLPAGAVELGDYNVMADFVPNTVAAVDTIATGILRKSCAREFVYVEGTGGTQSWAIAGPTPSNFSPGIELFTDRLNAYAEYTFFGTGFELRFNSQSNRSTNIAVTLNTLAATTANFASLVSSVYGTGVTFSAGVLDQQDAAVVNGSGLRISGLPLAKYTVRFTNGTASTYLILDCFDIITPIHSPKSDLYADIQNTLLVGSCAISDNRVVTPVKDALPETKAWAQAIGITSAPSTSSSTFVPLPDLYCTISLKKAGVITIDSSIQLHSATTGVGISIAAYVDGVQALVRSINQDGSQVTGANTISIAGFKVPVSAGTHAIQIYWLVGAASNASGIARHLTVQEM